MKKNKTLKGILLLGIAGVLFSGYVSAVKFFDETCAFGETCPYFLGYPACYFGFGMYLLITVFAALSVLGRADERKSLRAVTLISFLGILFAGYFTLGELPLLLRDGFSAYFLGLPTCALGLIFYVSVFLLALRESKPKPPADGGAGA